MEKSMASRGNARAPDPKNFASGAQDLIEEKLAHLETQALLSARDELLAIVSHDLRNPLTAVSMGLQILSDKLAKIREADPEIDHMFSIMQRNVGVIEGLITDLSDIDGKERVRIEPGKHSVGELLRDCAKLYAPIAEKNQVVLRIEDADPKIFAMIDRERILQVLSKLLGNAFKFTGPGGSIGVDAYSMGREIEFVVSDTGPGLSLEEQFKLFDRMSHVSGRGGSKPGLGLYIAKWIVEAHGGRFSVRSIPGQGSTYTFTVPAHMAEKAESPRLQ